MPEKTHTIRGLLGILWDFAMWRGDVPTQRNPMELVTIKGATRRMSKPRSLTVEEFQRFIVHLGEPFRTMALLCVWFRTSHQRSSSAQVVRCRLAQRQTLR
jgi:hypothetical protein